MHEQKYSFYCQICQFVGFLLPSSSRLLKLPSLAPREELIVFTYQLWKQQFLLVVQLQLPFAVLSDNVFWNIWNSYWTAVVDETQGHGFESRWSPNIFQASSFQLLASENWLRWSFFTFKKNNNGLFVGLNKNEKTNKTCFGEKAVVVNWTPYYPSLN